MLRQGFGKLNTLFLTVFLLLTAAILLELGFVTGMNFLPANKVVSKQQGASGKINVKPIAKVPAKNFAVNPQLLTDIGYFTDDVLLEATQVNLFKGKITEIITRPDKTVQVDISGPKTTGHFLFFDNSFRVMKVFKLTNKEEIKINFTDLKVGDNVTIKNTYSLLGECSKDECFQEIKIVKTN